LGEIELAHQPVSFLDFTGRNRAHPVNHVFGDNGLFHSGQRGRVGQSLGELNIQALHISLPSGVNAL
jgi:hypothetical protein